MFIEGSIEACRAVSSDQRNASLLLARFLLVRMLDNESLTIKRERFAMCWQAFTSVTSAHRHCVRHTVLAAFVYTCTAQTLRKKLVCHSLYEKVSRNPKLDKNLPDHGNPEGVS